MNQRNFAKMHFDCLRCGSVITLALVGATAAGCGDSKSYSVAPVSGIVTLDGKPLPQAEITFLPVGGADNPTPGPGSAGKADADGRYELETINQESGAVVGMHKVQIRTPRQQPPGNNDSGSAAPPHKEIIPARYNDETTLTFEVPEDGTTEANFPLESR
jgi:hypothetical protein